eukprot:COSAG02_NODE_14856_length_1229_cov_1.526549_1_plen_301_part_10
MHQRAADEPLLPAAASLRDALSRPVSPGAGNEATTDLDRLASKQGLGGSPTPMSAGPLRGSGGVHADQQRSGLREMPADVPVSLEEEQPNCERFVRELFQGLSGVLLVVGLWVLAILLGFVSAADGSSCAVTAPVETRNQTRIAIDGIFKWAVVAGRSLHAVVSLALLLLWKVLRVSGVSDCFCGQPPACKDPPDQEAYKRHPASWHRVCSKGDSSWTDVVAYSPDLGHEDNVGGAQPGRFLRWYFNAMGVFRLVVWHWTQPAAYLFIFWACFCSLSTWQRVLGTVVAARDVMYCTKTLRA